MELDTLAALPEADQQVFLLGRIAYETTRVDIGLRFVNGALRGEPGVDAYLDAPDNFSDNVKKSTALATKHAGLTDEGRAAVLAAIVAADSVYKRRNRYTHDFIRSSMMSDGWELARLERQPDEALAFTEVSFDEMVDLVLELVAVTWRLRGCGMYVLNGGRAGMALGVVEGD